MAGVVGSNPTRPTTDLVLFMDSVYIGLYIFIVYLAKGDGIKNSRPAITTVNEQDPLEMSGIFNVLMVALRRILKNKGILVNEKTFQQRREKYELAINPIASFIKDAISEESVESDRTTKDELYQAYTRFCKTKRLAFESENLGKILINKYRFDDGRQSSGERKTVWKGARLAEKYQIEPNQQILTV